MLDTPVYHLVKSQQSRKVLHFIAFLVGYFSPLYNPGAYILSPLEEGSRDPIQNYGFQISYKTSGEMTRLTSYSIRNSADASLIESPPVSPPPTSPGQRSRMSRRSSTKLSSILSSTSIAMALGESTSFAAFKALPIDPARSRRTTGSFEESADDLSFAKTCKEAVDVMVSSVQQACTGVGISRNGLVIEDDIVRHVAHLLVCDFLLTLWCIVWLKHRGQRTSLQRWNMA